MQPEEDNNTGYNIDNPFEDSAPVIQPTVNTPPSLNQPVSNQSNQSRQNAKPILKGLRLSITKYKTQIIISVVGLILFSISIILFMSFYDFTHLEWDNKLVDTKLVITGKSKLSLKVNAFDKQKNIISDIEFKVTGGRIRVDKQNVTWIMPDESGKYEITAFAPSGKAISKKINFVIIEDDELLGMGPSEAETDDSLDSDGDGLTDVDEKKHKTNPLSADTDGDGIIDSLEINIFKTDPLNADTDGDGLGDGDEIVFGLDPLQADTKGDDIKDGARTLSYELKDDSAGIKLDIVGKGNIASTTVDVFKNDTFAKTEGVINKVYKFYTPGTIDNVLVAINYDINEVQSQGLDEDELSLYNFDKDTKQLKIIDSKVDKSSRTITASLDHFSYYIVADSSRLSIDRKTRVMFLIDNSASMYSLEQLRAVGMDFYDNISDIGNDVDLKRLSLSKGMVDGLTGNYELMAAQFSGRDDIFSGNFSKDKKLVKDKIDSMNNVGYNKGSGTNIVDALESGIKKFPYEATDSHYLFLMTDGNDTTGRLDKERPSLIAEAKKRGVRVCIVGLGNYIDPGNLNSIASETGCKYYNVSVVDALDEIYKRVSSDINYNFTDTDGDGAVDGVVDVDSGFIISRDGFSFDNYSTALEEGGHCYGMAMFTMQHYTRQLPVTMESINTKGRLNLRYGSDVIADGYNLEGSYFFKDGLQTSNNLYDFNFSNEAIKFATYPGKTGNLYDWESIKDGTIDILPEYYGALEAVGAKFEVVNNKTRGDSADVPKKRVNALIDTESSKFKNIVSSEEQQLLRAIYRLFVTQGIDNSSSFSSLGKGDIVFNELKTNLEKGIPVVISTGNHAVNATKIITDIDNPNKFKVEVYDNNHPGESKYIEFTRKKVSDMTSMQQTYDISSWFTLGYTYDSSYNGESVLISINYPVFNN